MTDREEPYPGVKSTGTLFAIIEYMAENDGATVSELARELGFAKSSIHDHLTSLLHEEFVVKDGTTYRLGLQFLELGMKIKDRHVLSRVAEPKLEQLAEDTGEAVWLLVEEHGRAVYLHKVMGEKALQVEVSIGQRAYLHNLAAGKAILAHLPDERVDEIVDRHGLPAQTENTITDRDELEAELRAIRERGYAFNESEQIEGVRAVGAPILYQGEVLGAISITGAELGLRNERFREELPNLLMGVANEIEVHLNYRESGIGQ